MQISPVSFTQSIAPIQSASAVSSPSSAAEVSNSIPLEDSVETSASFAPAQRESALPQSDAEVSKALDKLFAEMPVQRDLALETPSSPASAQNRSVEGFYLADGSRAVETSVADCLGTENRVPTRADVADYTILTPEAAEAYYKEKVAGTIGPLEKATIKSYCTFAYKMMNGYLNGTKKSPTGTIHLATKCMTKALNRYDVPQGTVLYRTSNIHELRNYVTPEDFAKYQLLDDNKKTEQLAAILDLKLTGTQTSRKSYLSTTIDHKFDFEDKPKVATKLYVGDNVKGVYVGADRKLAPIEGEREYLLAPDTKVTVLGVDYDGKNNGLVLHVMLGDLPADKSAADLKEG